MYSFTDSVKDGTVEFCMAVTAPIMCIRDFVVLRIVCYNLPHTASELCCWTPVIAMMARDVP